VNLEPPNLPSTSMMTTTQAAAYLGLQPTTIRQYISRALLKPVKVGPLNLLSKDECDRFSQEKNPPGNPNFAKKHRKSSAKK